jgi:hypothetical protein
MTGNCGDNATHGERNEVNRHKLIVSRIATLAFASAACCGAGLMFLCWWFAGTPTGRIAVFVTLGGILGAGAAIVVLWRVNGFDAPGGPNLAQVLTWSGYTVALCVVVVSSKTRNDAGDPTALVKEHIVAVNEVARAIELKEPAEAVTELRRKMHLTRRHWMLDREELSQKVGFEYEMRLAEALRRLGRLDNPGGN